MAIVLGMFLFCIFQTILVKCIYKIICRIMVHKEPKNIIEIVTINQKVTKNFTLIH